MSATTSHGRSDSGVTVVMPVRNGRPYLDESIRSILDQSYAEFEFVILDDGSDDGSWEDLNAWRDRDDRIRLTRSDRTLGLAESSRRVVENATGALIARMDADDVSHRDRLQRQVDLFERYSDLTLVGCLADGIDGRGRVVRPQDASRVVRRSPFPPFPHGSAMFRRDIYDKVGGYREECLGWEDIDLFLRLQSRGRVLTLIDHLYSYRYHGSSWTMTRSDHRVRAYAMQSRCIQAYDRVGTYEDVLATTADEDPSPGERVLAYTYQSSVSIWSGLRPRSLSAAGVKLSIGSGWGALLRSIVNATWGRLAPVSLRAFLGLWTRVKDRMARSKVGTQGEVRWLTGH